MEKHGRYVEDSDKQGRFARLYADFDKRRPCGEPTSRAYWFTVKWTDGRKSINDLLREHLSNIGFSYLNTINGDVWFQFNGEWSRCEAESDGEIVRFYILEFEMG